ncbi:DUF368 domain-containing protein [Hoyosella altamirensis]|uniref:Putative membrane protein n=1 Tax=Hoyosella altamirensis TaxID=616997 RepID=A0A839RMQ0_9ACTN|nr:DUF368 domain-containing protein [Hoyosella altamirensis]MBB3037589.1 putative membrane protein [Hoyosella altamirensis]
MSNGTGTHLLNVARGGLMGTAEVIPGVSGGTVALITGIYDRLITSAGHAVSGIRIAATDLPRGQGTERSLVEFRRVHWQLVIGVLIGMAVMLVVAAKIVAPLVEEYPQRSFALFFGLVLASLWVPFTGSGRPWTALNYLVALAAAAAAFFLTGLPPTEISDPNPLLIIGAAAVAICALVLPGVSGSFMLLAFGMYTVTINAVNDRDFGYLALFALGAVLGLSLFVKLLQWLLEHYHHLTLVVMTGLLLGSLRALWPWQPWEEERRELLAPSGDLAVTFGLIGVGMAVVIGILVVAHRHAAREHEPGAIVQ